MLFRIVKFGGGCLHSGKDVKKLLAVLKILEGNIIVVSAFYGMTNVLVRAAKEYSFDIFLKEFLLPHRAIAKELGLDMLDDFFRQAAELAKYILSLAKENDPNGRHYSQLVAMGEDFAQIIVTMYLVQHMKSYDVEGLDARSCVIQKGSGYVNVTIDQVVTGQRIRELVPSSSSKSHIRVVQGFLAGGLGRSPEVVSLMRREGSDLTAALFAAALSNTELIYCKRFPPGGKSLTGKTGIGKFFDAQRELGAIIVSPEIVHVEGLPFYFRVVNFEDTKIDLYVVGESRMVEVLREKALEENA